MRRLFIAVLISPDLMHRLAQEQSQLKRYLSDRALRWVAPENFHITLLFLGEQPEERLQSIQSAVERASQLVSPFSVQVQGLGVFPNWNRPQVLWAGVEQGAESLQRIALQLEQSLLAKPSGKRFHAHITLARIKAHGASDLAKRMFQQVEPKRKLVFGTYEVAHLSLMQSELTPTGSRYTELERFALNPQAT